MSRNLKIILLLKLLLWIIIFYSGYLIYNWIKESYNNEQLINKINSMVTINEEEQLDVDTKNIININNDIKGWIKVEGTNINYPFVQTNNNDYYLNHTIDKSKNNAGWVFLDYRNNINELNENLIFYGHNRIDKTMFGTLKETIKNNSHYIYISTENYNSTYEIFSIYSINKTNDYLNTTINNDFIDLITNRTIKDFNNKPNEKDYLITLSTCYNSNERFVVHGKLIKKEGK